MEVFACNLPLGPLDETERCLADTSNIKIDSACARVELLRDVFVEAYERSAQQYAAVLQSPGEPDPFRFKYTTAIKEFVRLVETEIYWLHEGNFARYRITQSEFSHWHNIWNSSVSNQA